MILSLLLGLGAAILSPRVEPHLRALIADMAPAEAVPGAAEARVLTFALSLVVAAVIAHVLTHPSAFWLTFGALLGLAIPRLRAARRARNAPDYGDMP